MGPRDPTLIVKAWRIYSTAVTLRVEGTLGPRGAGASRLGALDSLGPITPLIFF